MAVGINNFTPEYIASILDYNPETGLAVWKERPRTDFIKLSSQTRWNKKFAGTQVGFIDPRDWRVSVSLFSTTFKLDQLIWILFHNEVTNIYHKNHWACDNRLDNLTPRTKRHTKYAPSNLQLLETHAGWYIMSESNMEYPSHCLGIYNSKRLAKMHMLELAEKLGTGWEDAEPSS